MKKILLTVVILVALVFGGLFAISKLAPIDRIKQEVVTQVKDKTGRDLSFSDAKIGFWPNIGVQLKDVVFSNADWSGEKNMVTLSRLDVQLAVLPLLKKQVEVKRFVLDRPVINLEKSADGRANWDFNRGDKVKAEEAAADKSGAPADYGFRLGEFEIKSGQLNYTDRQSGQTQLLEDVDVKIDYPDLASAVKIDGAFDYKGKRVTIGLNADKPLDLGGGKPSPGSLRVKSDFINAAVQGVFATTGTMLKDGAIEADISSLTDLAGWLGDGKKADMPFKKVSFRSKAEASAEKLSLDGAELSLDDISAKGDVSVNLAGERPSVMARLSLGKLALDRFAGTEAGGKNADVGSKPNEGWDATPIDFSGLKAVDADLVLDTQGFSLKGVDVGPSKLTAVLKGGNLQAASSKATLFGGSFSSNVSVNAAPATPTMAFKFNMDGVEAQPVLTTFVDFSKLSGKVDANVDVTASGKSQRDIVSSLNGSGAAVFKDGSLTGIDLLNIAKAVQGGLTNFGIGQGKTDFVELGGTFKISSGVAQNDDLKMKGPLLQASGSGNVDLPKKYVQYRVIPVLTASSAVENAKGIAVPVDISGPFSALKIRPDLQGAIQNVLDNPDALKGALKDVKAQGKALEDNIKSLKSDPTGALGSVLGGGGLFGNKAAKEVAAPAAKEVAPAAKSAVAPAADAAPAATPAVEAPAEKAPVEKTPVVETPKQEIPAPAATPAPAPAAEPAATESAAPVAETPADAAAPEPAAP